MLTSHLVPDGWQTLWQRQHEDVRVETGAIGVVDGDPALVAITEQWHNRVLGLLHCDNTELYRLADGSEGPVSIMYKYPFDTPRVEVCDRAVVINTGRGLHCYLRSGESVEELELASPEWHALDLVTGRVDGRMVVVAAWDVPLDETGLHLQPYDLTTGAAYGSPVPLPWRDSEWNWPSRWRLGRWDGRPVAGVVDDTLLYLYCLEPDGVEGVVPLTDTWQAPEDFWPELLIVDDRSGSTVAVVRQHDGVHCYAPETGEEYRPPLTGFPGEPSAARLGRWRGRPVVAVLTSVGFSLFDLRDVAWVHHVDLGRPVHDVAFGSTGELALVTTTGPMVIAPLD